MRFQLRFCNFLVVNNRWQQTPLGGLVVCCKSSHQQILYYTYIANSLQGPHKYVSLQQCMTISKYTTNSVSVSMHPHLSPLDIWIRADSPATKASVSMLSQRVLTKSIITPGILYFWRTSYIADLGTESYAFCKSTKRRKTLVLCFMAFFTNWHTQ